MDNIKSVKLENLDCVIGKNTKKHNTVTMRVDNDFIMEVIEYFEANRKGEEPTGKLKGLRLIAVYEDEEKADGEAVKSEDLFESASEQLDEVLADAE